MKNSAAASSSAASAAAVARRADDALVQADTDCPNAVLAEAA